MSISPIDPAAAGVSMQGMREIKEIRGIEGEARTKRTDGDLADSFSQVFAEARSQEVNASEMAQKFANGDSSVGIHEVVIAAEKASVQVRYATTLKNKAVEAYRELMNTQV